MAAEVHSLKTKNVGKAEGLLRSLVPRAQCFCFYSLSRECVWSSDGAEDYEIDSFIKDLPEEVVAELGSGDEPLRRTLSSGRTAIALPVYGEERERTGILIALFSKNAGKSASFNPSLLQSILEPAIEVIGESL
ncbi:MAG: hypothetical protein P8X94_05335 [Woeseiaceae bacterium]